MAVRDYTARILDKRAKQTSFDSLDYTPIAIPAGAVLPETTQQTMARMMLSSGMISLDDYHKMIGVIFDGDFKDTDEDFSDFSDSFREQFRQSDFAQYEEFGDVDNSGLRLESELRGSNEVPADGARTAAGADTVSVEKGQAETKGEFKDAGQSEVSGDS